MSMSTVVRPFTFHLRIPRFHIGVNILLISVLFRRTNRERYGKEHGDQALCYFLPVAIFRVVSRTAMTGSECRFSRR